MGDDLPVWWDFRNGAVPVVLSFSHYSWKISRKSRPDIRLGKSVYEAAVRKRFYHIDSSTVDSDDKGEVGNTLREVLKRIGIFLENNIGRELFLYEYIVEHIRMIIENGNRFLGKCFCHFTDNPSPGLYGKISELLHSDEEAYPRSFYFLTVVIERSDILVHEIPKSERKSFLIFILHKLWNSTTMLCMVGIRTSPRLFRKKMRKPVCMRDILCKYLHYNLYIALDQIHIGIVDI